MLVVNGETVEEDFAEEQRRSLRVALAQDMKRELIKGEQDRLTKVRGTKTERDRLTTGYHGTHESLNEKICTVQLYVRRKIYTVQGWGEFRQLSCRKRGMNRFSIQCRDGAPRGFIDQARRCLHPSANCREVFAVPSEA